MWNNQFETNILLWFVVQVTCTAQGLLVWVQNESYPCVRTGQVISVSVRMNGWVYSGQLICPTCSDFCSVCPLPHEIPHLNTTKSARLGELLSRRASHDHINHVSIHLFYVHFGLSHKKQWMETPRCTEILKPHVKNVCAQLRLDKFSKIWNGYFKFHSITPPMSKVKCLKD